MRKAIFINKEFFKKLAVFVLAASALLCGCGNNSKKVSGHVKSKKPVKKNDKYSGMVYIPPGEFTMGTDPNTEKEYAASLGFMNAPYSNETPQRNIYLKEFYIDKYEVTIGQYAEFAEAVGTFLPEPLQGLDVEKYKNYPVSCVTWQNAADYALWAKKRLPTEAQWEKAARGTDGRRYPWGNKLDESQGNFSKKGVFPVGSYKEDVSPYGVHGMAGSLDEWVSNWYVPYPGGEKDDEAYGVTSKVYRGGSWGGLTGHLELFEYFSRTAYRGYEDPEIVSNLRGFRCVRD